MFPYQKFMCKPLQFDVETQTLIVQACYSLADTFEELMRARSGGILRINLSETTFSFDEMEELRKLAAQSRYVLEIVKGMYHDKYGWRFTVCVTGANSTSAK